MPTLLVLNLDQKIDQAHSLRSSALHCRHVHSSKDNVILQKYAVNVYKIQCQDIRKNSKALRYEACGRCCSAVLNLNQKIDRAHSLRSSALHCRHMHRSKQTVISQKYILIKASIKASIPS